MKPIKILTQSLLLIFPLSLFAHGTLVNPVSRIKACYDNANNTAACAAARDKGIDIYQWRGVRSAGNALPSGQTLCSGGNIYATGDTRNGADGKVKMAGLDLPRQDFKTTQLTPDANGNVTLEMLVTAPHATDKLSVYLSNNDYDFSHSLGLENMRLLKHQYFNNAMLARDQKIEVKIPSDVDTHKNHVLYLAWHVAGGIEIFHACSNIRFADTTTPPPLAQFHAIKSLPVAPHEELPVGTKIHFVVEQNTPNGYVTVADHTLTTTAAMQTANNGYQYDLAAIVNQNNNTIKIGKLQANGAVVPVSNPTSADMNQVYVYTTNKDAYRVMLMQHAPEINQGLDPWHHIGELLPLPNAQTVNPGDTIKMRVLDEQGRDYVTYEVALDKNKDVSYGQWQQQLADVVNADNNGLKIGVLQDGQLLAPVEIVSANQRNGLYGSVVTEADVLRRHNMSYMLEVIPKALPEPTPSYDYVYPDGIGQYQTGKTVVKGLDGKLYQCREFPYGAWCNINSALYYGPGTGIYYQHAWNKMED